METTMLPVAALHPNDYNPNEMTEAEFAELVAEVRHLGGVPKPIVVRRNEAGYSIVDGELGWRAAQEAELSEIPCEVVDTDDFESMRQTYKRNQHGTHNQVRLGRMFRQMMAERQLSQRTLAQEIDVSEGTVRNALGFAEAGDLRNCYAFERLTVRQVRTYLSLPNRIRDIWLDAGADLKALDRALLARVLLRSEKWETIQFSPEYLQEVVAAGFDICLVGTRGGFVESVHRALQLLQWRESFHSLIKDVDGYIQPVARLKLPPATLDKYLRVELIEREPGHTTIKPFQSAEEWDRMLTDCTNRAADEEEREAMLAASVRLFMQQAGRDAFDHFDPRVAELLEDINKAPDFIRESPLSLMDKWEIAILQADQSVAVDVVNEAKQETVSLLVYRDAVLTGQAPDVLGLEDRPDLVEFVKEEQSQRTPKTVFVGAINRVMGARRLAEQKTLFADRSKLLGTVLSEMGKAFMIREGRVDGRPALEVLAERLSDMPEPEFRLLAAYISGYSLAAPTYWTQGFGDRYEQGKSKLQAETSDQTNGVGDSMPDNPES